MALNNLKAMMKEPMLDEDETKKPPSLLKRKPGMKMPGAPKMPSSLLSRLTGGK